MNPFTFLVAALFAAGPLLLAVGCGSNKRVEKTAPPATGEPKSSRSAESATPSKTDPKATPARAAKTGSQPAAPNPPSRTGSPPPTLAPSHIGIQAPVIVQAAEWKEFRSKDEPFTILFPGDPKISKKTTLTQKRHMLDVDGPRGTKWTLGYTDYLLAPQPEALKSALSKEGRHMIADASIRVSGYPGRDFAFEMTADGQKFYCWNRLVLVEKRLYHLIVVSSDENFVSEADRKRQIPCVQHVRQA